MSPEERAEDIITWTMPDTYHTRLVKKIAGHIREAVATERNRCIATMRDYLQFNDQRAVSYHEVQDCIDAIRQEAKP